MKQVNVVKQLFKNIINGSKQYVVPLFQRSYSWGKKEWETLWEDLIDLYDDGNNAEHFFGSIVLIPLDSDVRAKDIDKCQLIDGQQRITTIFVLLIVLRNLATVDSNFSKEIERMISNSSLEENDEHFKNANGHLKVLPTQVDRPAFKRLVERKNCDCSDKGDVLIDQCYAFFKTKINKFAATDEELLSLYRVILNNLCVVTITLDQNDNPYLIFESLNAKGQPLSQADLIRNYAFMKIAENDQNEMHTRYWEPMQTALGDSLTEFVRHYLIMRNSKEVRKNCVYLEIKLAIKDNVQDFLQNIHMFALYYQKLLIPDQEDEYKIREVLIIIKKLKQTTLYPFLLKCYEDYAHNKISAEYFVTILNIIENFIVRRHICAVPTNTLNKIFAVLYRKLTQYTDQLDGLRCILQQAGYPDNDILSAKLQELLSEGKSRKNDKSNLVKAIIADKLMKAKKKLPQCAEQYVAVALEIWPYFGIIQDENLMDNLSNTKPSVIRFFGTQKVKHWSDVLIKTLTDIADLQPELLPILAERYSGWVGTTRFSKCHALPNGFYINTRLSAKDIHKFCINAIELMNKEAKIKEVWEIELDNSAVIIRFPQDVGHT